MSHTKKREKMGGQWSQSVPGRGERKKDRFRFEDSKMFFFSLQGKHPGEEDNGCYDWSTGWTGRVG